MQPLIDAVLTKRCTLCKEIKTLDNYHPNKSCKYGVVATCKPCSAIRIAQWYSDNRSRRREAANERNQRRKKEVIEHFGGRCFDCRQSYQQCVYQFHHLDPTKKDVNPSYAMTKNPTNMWKELDKCVMLCANCHMIRHHGKEGVDDSTVN